MTPQDPQSQSLNPEQQKAVDALGTLQSKLDTAQTKLDEDLKTIKKEAVKEMEADTAKKDQAEMAALEKEVTSDKK
ncbi:MAG: hypothetical protein L7F78_05010 [Syntrophales bacterium LBB04]|nr:hypothetical protein [Syntrophales bacterium LBB04]